MAGTTRLIFGAVATAIFSNVTNNKYDSALLAQVTNSVSTLNFPSANLAKLAAAAKLGTTAAYNAVPGITPAIMAAATRANKLAYLEGTHLTFLVAMGFGFIACIAALFTVSIDTRKYTNKTMAVVEEDHKHLEEMRMRQNATTA